MIRLILIALSILVYLILGIPAFWVLGLIGRRNPRFRDLASLRMVQGVFRWLLFLTGSQITYKGLENIPKGQAVLYIANHRSFFDIVATYARCPDLTGYVGKIELQKIPLLRSWMKRLYCLFLDREDMRAGMQMILTGIEYIKKGISICIFPEGTRSKDGSLLPFKEGSMKMASKTGCPIVPIAITGTSQIWEDHFPFIKPSQVTVEYGAPIDPKALTKEEQKFLGSYTRQKIQEMLERRSLEESH